MYNSVDKLVWLFVDNLNNLLICGNVDKNIFFTHKLLTSTNGLNTSSNGFINISTAPITITTIFYILKQS